MLAIYFLIASSSALAESPDTPDMRCGAYCLYISLKALGAPVASYADVEAKLGPASPSGYSLALIAEVAKHQYGLNVLGVVSTAENLRRRSPPFACIAHLRNNHFVNIADITDDTATIIDPPRQFEMPVDALAASWNGHALLLSTAPLAREEDLTRPISHFAWPLGLLGLVVFAALLGWRRVRGERG